MQPDFCQRPARRKSPRERGQITIFLVMVFPIFFVFFAMVMNIGLVVHEKISVQNAADLAAIYGAQRQAELLNAIGHTNYQIRQAWKLFAYRIRVFGDFGRTSHPLRDALGRGSPTVTGNYNEAWPGALVGEVAADQQQIPPAVCIRHGGWVTDPRQVTNSAGDNLCKSNGNVVGVRIPRLPQITVIMPWDAIVKSSFQNVQRQIDNQCAGAGAGNWQMAAAFMAMYRLDVRNKLQRIAEFKKRLENGTDIRGQSIALGVRKTFKANLTAAVSEDFDFSWINSLSNGSAAFNERNWLRINYIYPMVYFVGQSQISQAVGCAGNIASLVEAFINPQKIDNTTNPSVLQRHGYLQGGNKGLLAMLSVDNTDAAAMEWNPASPLYQFSSNIGVEKNPWIAIYSGVRASVSALKPFFPIGNSHNVTAESYAMPFGASVGPWFRSTWPAGSSRSQGVPTDPLLPDIFEPQAQSGTPAISFRNIPNYSRFPGDLVGLGSVSSLQEPALLWPKVGTSFRGLYTEDFIETFASDALMGGGGNSQVPKLMSSRLELLAVMPDLFDLTYYSIEPRAAAFFDTTTERVMVPDYSADTPPSGVRDLVEAMSSFSSRPPYRISRWDHLLTGWAPQRIGLYGTPAERFGNCAVEVSSGEKSTSGNCVVGGRSGYSVKVVSKRYLRRDNLPLGGLGAIGPLSNPPN